MNEFGKQIAVLRWIKLNYQQRLNCCVVTKTQQNGQRIYRNRANKGAVLIKRRRK